MEPITRYDPVLSAQGYLVRLVCPPPGGRGWIVAGVAYRCIFAFFAGRSWSDSRQIAERFWQRIDVLSDKGSLWLQRFKRQWKPTTHLFVVGPHLLDARAQRLLQPRVAAGEQNSQLASFKRLGWRRNTLWPPWESTLGQPSLAGPETLTIVAQDLDRFVASMAVNENASVEGITVKHLATKTG